MLITRRSDYAMRIFRALQDEKVHNVREICTKEDIPKAFAYKILRELEQAGFVKSERGNQGGYLLNRKLEDLTMYDVISVTEGDFTLHERGVQPESGKHAMQGASGNRTYPEDPDRGTEKEDDWRNHGRKVKTQTVTLVCVVHSAYLQEQEQLTLTALLLWDE